MPRRTERHRAVCAASRPGTDDGECPYVTVSTSLDVCGDVAKKATFDPVAHRKVDMKRVFLLAACTALPLMSAHAQDERIGSFDRRSIVVAFYRSPQFAEMLKRQIAARDSAKRVGDTARVRELERWGAAHQELAHQQLYGDAALTNILEALKPALDSIGRQMKLSSIIPAPAPKAHAQVVDVTPQLLDWLKADDKTREIVRQLPPRR